MIHCNKSWWTYCTESSANAWSSSSFAAFFSLARAFFRAFFSFRGGMTGVRLPLGVSLITGDSTAVGSVAFFFFFLDYYHRFRERETIYVIRRLYLALRCFVFFILLLFFAICGSYELRRDQIDTSHIHRSIRLRWQKHLPRDVAMDQGGHRFRLRHHPVPDLLI